MTTIHSAGQPAGPNQSIVGALPVFLIMGVSGSGKSTIGALLAQSLNLPFLDADLLHSPQNISKMKAGNALTDVDRAAWLASVAKHVAAWQVQGQAGVLACSALRRQYRRQIVGQGGGVQLIYLQAPITLIRQRLEQRHGHFMPASLLASQFDVLEEPQPDERALLVDMTGSAAQAVQAILTACGLASNVAEQVRWVQSNLQALSG